MKRFKTAEIADLYEAIKGRGHLENQFLDKSYSLGGYYPVTDFTQIIAELLLANRIEAIEELWGQLTHNDANARLMLSRSMAAKVNLDLGLDEQTMAEAKAIYILGSRMSLYETSIGSVAFEMGLLLATRLASIQWTLPASEAVRLKAGAEVAAAVMDGPGVVERRRVAAETAMRELLTPLDASVSLAGELLVKIPPMPRIVISDFFERGERCLRYALYYSDRKYGCNADINQYYVDTLGWFRPPSDSVGIPHAVTKSNLLRALADSGVSFKKTATKNQLVDEARKHPGLVRSIFDREFPQFRVPCSEWDKALRLWCRRFNNIIPIARAVLGEIGMQAFISNS